MYVKEELTSIWCPRSLVNPEKDEDKRKIGLDTWEANHQN